MQTRRKDDGRGESEDKFGKNDPLGTPLLEHGLRLRVSRQMGLYPVAEPCSPEAVTDGVPEEVAAYVGQEDDQQYLKETQKAEVRLEDDPEAEECRDIAEEDRRQVDDKIDHRKALSQKKGQKQERIGHFLSISWRKNQATSPIFP